jgi:S-adenosylmethionine-dependent methyltransferase
MAEVEPFYDDYAAYEWDRLGRHKTEFAVTLRAMEEFLPAAPCSILDIGVGPGRYAIELSQRVMKTSSTSWMGTPGRHGSN